ncbi:ABC-2 transporter permease [Paenibacillus guangzhouensis]|uniref:ABC-2 transporter permease n=1 Tax=Paenibacillus guangzhouensis TaxID=1473112 RepID=UPI001267709D|nr:ABC-2 transporter permease [Paenibacillus guangzhouensis]
MRGLILTNYYLVYRSLFAYIGIAILVSGLIFYFGEPSMYHFVAMITILLIAAPAIEVIKYEGKSGYDKYVLTLPVTRRHVVQSHYLFYFFVVMIGMLLSFGLFYGYGQMSAAPVDGVFKTVMLGTFIVLFAGAIAYPLLYVFGSEKSDAISIGGAVGGLFVAFGLQGLINDLIAQPPLSNINPSISAPVAYAIIGVILYILSFFISLVIYQRKEF